MKCFYFPVAILGLLAAPAGAATVMDDFNDGNDTGWTRLNPIGVGSYAFPSSSGYQISTAVSPAPLIFGPGRAASVRDDVSQTQFNVTADLVNWDASKPAMVAGVLARISYTGSGLGSVNGYGLIYDAAGFLRLTRITGEVGSILNSAPVSLLPVNDYGLSFSGTGSALSGTLYDLAAPSVILATVSFTDATYASGVPGLLVYDGSLTANQTASATFDNFSAQVPEPSGSVLAVLAGLLGLSRRRRD